MNPVSYESLLRWLIEALNFPLVACFQDTVVNNNI